MRYVGLSLLCRGLLSGVSPVELWTLWEKGGVRIIGDTQGQCIISRFLLKEHPAGGNVLGESEKERVWSLELRLSQEDERQS